VSKIVWPKLMQLGLVQLGLRPDQFWALTPAELMLMAGVEGEVASLSRGGFSELSARFPDKT